MKPTEEIHQSAPSASPRTHSIGLRGGDSATAPAEAKLIAEAVKQGLKEALANEDQLINYTELSRRMQLKEKFVRRLKNAGIIHAALDLGKIVRFHWPSVLAELKCARAHRHSGR